MPELVEYAAAAVRCNEHDTWYSTGSAVPCIVYQCIPLPSSVSVGQGPVSLHVSPAWGYCLVRSR